MIVIVLEHITLVTASTVQLQYETVRYDTVDKKLLVLSHFSK